MKRNTIYEVQTREDQDSYPEWNEVTTGAFVTVRTNAKHADPRKINTGIFVMSVAAGMVQPIVVYVDPGVRGFDYISHLDLVKVHKNISITIEKDKEQQNA